MKFKEIKLHKGVAGLNVFLSVIAMLFMIGIITMIFMLAGSKISESVQVDRTSNLSNVTTDDVVNITGAYPTGLRTLLGCDDLVITRVENATGSGEIIASGNYTILDCLVKASTTVSSGFNNTLWNITGTYNYKESGDASASIDETTSALGTVTDWFPTIIVLGAMVVLILLVVIIINPIKGSGITEGA